MPKPMLGPNDPESQDQDRPASAPPGPQPARQESPLASQLPSWDLIPPHTLLVRRRLVKN